MRVPILVILALLCAVLPCSQARSAVSSPKLGRSTSITAASTKAAPTKTAGKAVAKGAATKSVAADLPASVKLVIGALGIYGAFLYYGLYQEEVFDYKAKDGSRFKSVWLLNTIEAMANVVVAAVGLQTQGGMTSGLPLKSFAWAGASQTFAKAFTLSALAQGVSFPVVTLAKSGKMVPVMIGSILLGGAKYTLKEYASVAAIILGKISNRVCLRS